MSATSLTVKNWFERMLDTPQRTEPDVISEKDHRGDVESSKDPNPIHTDLELAHKARYPNLVLRGKLVQGRAESAIAKCIQDTLKGVVHCLENL
jgi:hypothetical protein